MEVIFEYELLNFVWETSYDFDAAHESSKVRDESDQTEPDGNSVSTLLCDADGIPMGTSLEAIKLRRQIIFDFYEEWKILHPEKAVYNQSLKADILIRQESVVEAAAHASKRYMSTLAVLRLDEILAGAVQVASDAPKPGNKNQSKLVKMLLMSFEDKAIGKVKLTVGVRRGSLDKIQYGITAMEEGERIAPAVGKNRKKKAPHK